jgi:integrase
MTLTAKRVAKLIRKGEPGRHLDSRGLYLITQSPTAAHWEKRYQLDGKEHYHGLGSAFTFSLAEARVRNRRASQLLEDGVDPLAAKREAKAQRIAAAARTVSFGEAATDYYRAHSPGWGHAKHIAQWRASVLGLTMTGKPTAHDYCKQLRALPVAQIDTPLILHVLRPLWHDKPETMSRVRARIASVLDFAKAAGYRQGDNPASWDVIGKLLPARGKVAPVNHYEAVDYRLVPQFVAELRKREGTAATALMFLIYTAARTNEVLGARWHEINLDEARWTIPASRMKAGKPHRVPLAPEAIALLRGLYREGDRNDSYVFLSPRSGEPWSATALRAVMQRMGYSATPHGFRSSFSDWAHEQTAHANHTIELSLAHSIGSEAEKAYRRGPMIEKRRRLMLDWAKYCTSPPVVQTAEGKVVPMGRGRA